MGKQCINCKTIRASFGLPGQKLSHCAKCKSDLMIDSRTDNKCKCGIRSSFGLPDQKPSHCAKCKTDLMIDLRISGKCKCGTRASFGLSDKKPSHCIKCKTDVMIDLRINNKCECGTRACYGISGQKAIHCTDHREINEILQPTKKCLFEKCKKYAIYGYDKNTHCEQHKLNDHNNFTIKKCENCEDSDVLDILNKCLPCRNGKNIKRLGKQKTVREYLKENNENKYVSSDKIIQNTNHKYRPDFLYNSIHHNIIIEVDEDQHSDRLKDDEITRMKNIGNSLKNKVIFIRYNPDKYKHKTKTTDQIDRLKSLNEILTYWTNNKLPDEINIGVIYMFYDHDDKSKWNFAEKIN